MKKFELLWKRIIREKWAEDKDKALELIQSGQIHVQSRVVDNPYSQVALDCSVRLAQQKLWVSRGAYKLLTAVKAFGLSFDNQVCLDVGASSGGFTQVLLEKGAKVVYAVDVGYGQLHEKLRSDQRVVVFDRLNARELDENFFPQKPQWVVSDVSFISLTLLLEAMMKTSAPDAQFVLLVKPQFEVSREQIGPGGIVSDPAAQYDALRKVLVKAQHLGLSFCGFCPSDLKGTKGNQEYIVYLKKLESVTGYIFEQLERRFFDEARGNGKSDKA